MVLRVSHIIRRGKCMKKAVFPGSFDPITLGHVDIIERAARLFDEVIVVILNNSEKQTLFTLEQRMTFLNHALHHIPNVRCESDAGLTVEFAKREQACAIIRGVRSVKDYEYEVSIASLNHHMQPSIETITLFADPKYSYVSSSMIREMMKYNQDVSAFVSEEVYQALKEKM